MFRRSIGGRACGAGRGQAREGSRSVGLDLALAAGEAGDGFDRLSGRCGVIRTSRPRSPRRATHPPAGRRTRRPPGLTLELGGVVEVHVSDCPHGLRKFHLLGSRGHEPDRGHRARRHGGQPGAKHRAPRRADCRPQSDDLQDGGVLSEFASEGDFTGSESLEEFVAALERPRRIIVMVKAGAPVDGVIESTGAVARRGRHHHRRGQLALRRHAPPRGRVDRARGCASSARACQAVRRAH